MKTNSQQKNQEIKLEKICNKKEFKIKQSIIKRMGTKLDIKIN